MNGVVIIMIDDDDDDDDDDDTCWSKGWTWNSIDMNNYT